MKQALSVCLGGLLALSFGCEARQLVLVPGLDGSLPPILDPVPAAPDGLLGLRIDPNSASLTDARTPPAAVAFRALGQFEDREEDLSATVLWRLVEPDMGSLVAGVFTASGIGGTAQVEARIGTFSAQASVIVRVDQVIVSPAVSPAVVARFPEDATQDPEDGPSILYPAPDVVLPANMPSPRLEWAAHPEAIAYELRFESSAGRLRVYTDQTQLELEAQSWAPWLATHVGRGFSYSVRAATDTGVHGSVRQRIEVSEAAISGTAYYWSTKASAILKARLSDRSSSRFFPSSAPVRPDAGFDDAGDPVEPGDTPGCASCHSLSRDGRRMALGYEGEKLLVLDVSGDVATRLGPPLTEKFAFGSFNPDATRLAFTDKGRLKVMELDGFQIVQQLEVGRERSVSHPDWSPDGRALVVAYTRDDEVKNKEIEDETDLARIPVSADGVLGAPEVIVPASGEHDVLHSPSHSPDGRWVAYVRSDEKSKDNKHSELWLVPSDGRGSPIALTRLNRHVGARLDASEIGNSMPSWVRGEGGQDWLVFSSRREYGRALQRDRRDQLWISAIDLDRATEGLDPSAPAFWVPFQELDDDTHRAFFADEQR